MTKELSISIAVPPDREKQVAEIFFGNEELAELNQEQGAVLDSAKNNVTDYELHQSCKTTSGCPKRASSISDRGFKWTCSILQRS